MFTTTGTSSFPADLTLGHRGVDRGLSAFDHRHRVVFLYVYDIPKLRTSDSNFAVKALGALVNGWQTSGSFAYQSGAPETVTDGFDANGDGQANDRPILGNSAAPLNTFAIDDNNFALGGSGTPDVLCAGAAFLNTNLACIPVTANSVHWIIPASGVGNVGRNTQIAPGRQDTTFAVQKTINLYRERHQLVFRTEMLNPFNHPNTGNADFNLLGIQANPVTGAILDQSQQTFNNYPATVSGFRTVRFWLKYVF